MFGLRRLLIVPCDFYNDTVEVPGRLASEWQLLTGQRRCCDDPC